MTSSPIRIGTRASALAMAQTTWVAARLQDRGTAVEILTISTRGDERRDIPISRIGGDGVFVRELEQALLDGRIDVAVHSLKDMPTALPEGLVIACVPQRVTPFDACVSRDGRPLDALPPGAVVGTSSIRRVAQLKLLRPDLVTTPVRGNVDTRLRKLDAGECDALLLAAAGLERLGLDGRITHLVQPPEFWPAVGQGAIAIQSRASDHSTRACVASLDDTVAHAAVVAERRMLETLAGGCLAPIGGWGRVTSHGVLTLGGCVLDLDESSGEVRQVVVEEGVAIGDDPSSSAASLGQAVARGILDRGGAEMLAHMRTLPG